LRNSNTARKGGFGRRWLAHRFLIGLALVCSAVPANAIDPDRAISQYIRDRWGSDKGFPGGSVSAIAQSADGYLWIGTDKGLIRFDGLNFQVFALAVPSALPIGPIQGLMADAEGNLWIVLQSTQILRYHEGKFELGRGEAEFGITSVSRRGDGTVLLSSLALGTLAFLAGKYEILMSPSELSPPEATATTEADTRNTRLSWAIGFRPQRLAPPNSAVTAMAETADGNVWLGTRDKGLFYMSQGRVFAVGQGLANTQINCLLAFENRELWIGTDSGMVRWSGTGVTSSGVPDALRHIRVFSMIRDRNSNIWVGTAGGLIRVNPQGVSADRAGPKTSPVTALFEDREGNLWTGGLSGIQRLRDSAFVTYSVANGLPSERNGPVYVDQQGRTWFAPLEGGLQWMKGRQHGSVTEADLARDVVYSISGSENELWVGRQRGGLTFLRTSGGSFTAKTYTQADGLAQNSVYAVQQSRDGTVWAGTLGSGVSAFRNGRFSTYTTANGMSSNTVTSITESPDGTVWVATPNGLNAFSNGRWRVFTLKDGLPSADLNCVLADSMGLLWIGSTAGIAFLTSDHVQVPPEVPAPLREQIFGIAEDKNGWLWLATSNHILRVRRNRLLSKGSSDADVREYGLTDGLLGTEGIKRHRSVIADPMGKIWFSVNRGLSVVDPNQATGSSVPALVQIETVTVDGNTVDRPIRFSSAQQRIMFSYTGLSLSSSERVRYRYRLDGFDHDWSDPTTTRTAIYTNLSPRSYRFRVIASNSDGLWNGAEADVGLRVTPTLWQTWWFRLGLVLCVGLVTLAIYRLRVHEVTRLLNARFEARLSERTRIARELHDTLLQSFQGLLLRFQAASNVLPTQPEQAKQRLDSAIDQAAQAIAEGRDAVQGLRSSVVVTDDLATALSTLAEELAGGKASQNSPVFDVEVEGSPRELQPILRDEVYRIAGEALRNAFSHAQARRIELEIRYAESQLRLRIRDDGKGMDSRVLDGEGKVGHWGLRGIRERAKLVGGNLEVWSKPDSGTEIELSIPASTAYARSTSRRRSWFSRKRIGVPS
jgi:ligand-binding sensor domain-containing protein/signal transduction histidine kinase